MISRILVALFAGCTVSLFAADPVVDKAVQDAQIKYPPGDYNTDGVKQSITSRLTSFEIHAVAPQLDATKRWYRYDHDDGTVEKLALESEVLMNQDSIKAAWVEHDREGKPEVILQFTAAGTEKFSELTQKLLNQRIGILLDGQIVAAPVIRSPIHGGNAIFSAASEKDAAEMAAKLNPPPQP